ncbi:MAG: hypothetical protein JXR61_05345 [Prolixibacteraceae bacterium]|jgi:hypothetical protein|nr:hypothetical protein [Prolixibacteraceae bacterium]
MKLNEKFPPSPPCSCPVCQAYCLRPGWWTPEEAEKAINSGYGFRMMLEVSPEKKFCVLSPAFKGNETNFALQLFSKNGCTFQQNGLCELFGSGIQPLECRFCYHERKGKGKLCHKALEEEWKRKYAKRIVVRWGILTNFWQKHGFIMVEK